MQNDISKNTQSPAQKQTPGKDQNPGKPADKMSTEKKGGCGC